VRELKRQSEDERFLSEAARPFASWLSQSSLPATGFERTPRVAAADQSLTDREMINRLWDLLDDPHPNRALGITQNSRAMLGPYPKRR
jgi:hypothetical protein